MAQQYFALELIDKSFGRGGSRTEILLQVSLGVAKGISSPSSAIRAAASRPCSTSSPC